MAFFGTAVDALKTIVIALGAGLGLRRGELCGLEWKDFDFEKRPYISADPLSMLTAKSSPRNRKQLPVKAC